VTGLLSNTQYHFRISATNKGGTAQGSDRTFTTLSTIAHWYKNGALLAQGARTRFVAWGTVALTSSAGSSVVCHTVSGGYVENPAGGANGVAQIEALATYRCESHKFCPSGAGTEVIAEQLPSSPGLEVTEYGAFRSPTTGVKESINCIVGGSPEVAARFATNQFSACCAALSPQFNDGASPALPSSLEYAAGSGALEEEGSGEAVKATTEGETRLFGYNSQEVISARSP
jgi:hypothetical protein